MDSSTAYTECHPMGSVTAQNKFRADPPEAEQRLELAAGLAKVENV